MTPKEKAQELVDKMYKAHSGSYSNITMFFAKHCALIAVEEILDDDVYDLPDSSFDIRMDYWLGVKQELEKM
jgi:hypothetical protein